MEATCALLIRLNGAGEHLLLDRIVVEYYGTPTPLKSLAGISTPDASTIAIQPYDKTTLSLIEKAISMDEDIGLTPNNDGSVIRLNIPPLTSERREELVKVARSMPKKARSPFATCGERRSTKFVSKKRAPSCQKMRPVICKIRCKKPRINSSLKLTAC